MENTVQPDAIQLFRKGEDKSNLSQIYYPSVRFQIPSELGPGRYIQQLTDLFTTLILSLADTRDNKWAAKQFYFAPINDEGGMGNFYIGEEYYDHCKVFVYDDSTIPNIGEWKGFQLCNHFDQRSKVAPLYLLAEKFEEHIQKNNVPYQRFGRKINGGECEQRTV